MHTELTGGDRDREVLDQFHLVLGGLGHAVGVPDEPVLALRLRHVHRQVGVADEIHGGAGLVRECDTDARSDEYLLSTDSVRLA